ncbi:MAG: ankyrin repeat domain-containing protein [Planctomycetota bacterium]
MDYALLILSALSAVLVLGGCRFAQHADGGAEMHRHPAPDDPLLARAVAMLDDGDAEGLRWLLAEHPGLVEQRLAGGHEMYEKGYFRGAMLLHFVAANPLFEGERLPSNLVEIAGVILDAGAEVDAGCGEAGEGTTLGLVASGMLARVNGLQEPLIRLLVERGADPDRAIGGALGQGEIDAARLLIELGAEKTLPVYAAFNEPQAVKRIVQQENPSERERRLALAYAALFGHKDPIFYLCSADYGDTPNDFNPEGAHAHATPLHLAAYHGHLDAARELVKWGARLETKDKLWGSIPRGWAEYGGHPEIVALLDEAAAVVPVVHAALAGDLETLGAILDQEPHWLDAELPIFGGTLVGNLCYLNNRRTAPGRTIRFLVEGGASVEQAGPGESYLHIAASDGSAELGIQCIDALLDAGADIDVLGGVMTGGTPLHNATIFQLREIGAHLIERGATVDLVLAAGNGRFDLVEAMFDETGNRRADAPRVPHYQEEKTAQHDINWAFWMAGKAGDVQTLAFLYPKIDELVTIPGPSNVVDQAVQYGRAEAEAWLRVQGLVSQAERDALRHTEGGE